MFGSNGRLLFQFLGFLFLIYAAYIAPNKKNLIKKSIITFLFYVTIILISLANEQDVFDFNNVILGLICFVLTILGLIIGKNYSYFEYVSNIHVLLFSSLLFLTSFYFQNYLNVNFLNSRSLDLENSVNTIGMAFTNGMSFFFFYYLLHRMKKANIVIRGVIFFSILVCLFNVLATQSRGAIIYILLTFLIIHLKDLISGSYIFKFTLSFIFIILVFYLIYPIVVDYFPILESRFVGLLNRFENLFLYSQNKNVDLSSQARQVYLANFYNEFYSFILLGQFNYKPYPHNIFLELIMRWGLIGVAVLFLILKSFYKAIYYVNSKIKSTFSIPILICILFVFCLLQSLSSLSLEMNRMLWLGLGFFITFKK
jgi:hypothetical protein